MDGMRRRAAILLSSGFLAAGFGSCGDGAFAAQPEARQAQGSDPALREERAAVLRRIGARRREIAALREEARGIEQDLATLLPDEHAGAEAEAWQERLRELHAEVTHVRASLDEGLEELAALGAPSARAAAPRGP